MSDWWTIIVSLSIYIYITYIYIHIIWVYHQKYDWYVYTVYVCILAVSFSTGDPVKITITQVGWGVNVQTISGCGLEHEFYFFHILGLIIPIDFHIFHRGWNHQSDFLLEWGCTETSMKLCSIGVMWLKHCHKLSSSHHDVYRWYGYPSHEWFMTLF